MKTLFIIFLITSLVRPINSIAEISFVNNELPWSLKLRTAYFLPADKKVRKIYSDAWPDYQFELSKLINNRFAVWSHIGWNSITGSALSCEGEEVSRNKTTLFMVPFSLGINYNFPLQIDNASFYLGAGGSSTFVRITDHSEFVKKHRTKNGAFGGVLKSGFQYWFKNNIFIDVFADYSFLSVHFHERNNNVENSNACLSGLNLGIGLGSYF